MWYGCRENMAPTEIHQCLLNIHRDQTVDVWKHCTHTNLCLPPDVVSLAEHSRAFTPEGLISVNDDFTSMKK